MPVVFEPPCRADLFQPEQPEAAKIICYSPGPLAVAPGIRKGVDGRPLSTCLCPVTDLPALDSLRRNYPRRSRACHLAALLLGVSQDVCRCSAAGWGSTRLNVTNVLYQISQRPFLRV